MRHVIVKNVWLLKNAIGHFPLIKIFFQNISSKRTKIKKHLRNRQKITKISVVEKMMAVSEIKGGKKNATE